MKIGVHEVSLAGPRTKVYYRNGVWYPAVHVVRADGGLFCGRVGGRGWQIFGGI